MFLNFLLSSGKKKKNQESWLVIIEDHKAQSDSTLKGCASSTVECGHVHKFVFVQYCSLLLTVWEWLSLKSQA